jgi:hypothetical protein
MRYLSFALLLLLACGKKESPPGATSAAPPPPAGPPAPPPRAAPRAPPPGAPPADGKYERVQVDGVTVPMVQVMNGGQILLVDTDGAKPRTWEEQYKRKRELPNGQYDLHKTNTNKNDTFEDDAIDREGLWVIDAKANVTKH